MRRTLGAPGISTVRSNDASPFTADNVSDFIDRYVHTFDLRCRTRFTYTYAIVEDTLARTHTLAYATQRDEVVPKREPTSFSLSLRTTAAFE